MQLESIANRHRGEVVWVIGSGQSLSYFDPEFFGDKITIGVNLVSLHSFRTTYSITKYFEDAERLIKFYGSQPRVFIPEYEHGNLRHDRTDISRTDCFVFRHNNNPGSRFDEECWPVAPDSLVASWSTMGSAIHLAAFMGASTCILVGHDAGELDGAKRISTYPAGDLRELFVLFPEFERQTILIKKIVAERFGMKVYSLNPFVNFNLEGHSFVSRSNQINLPLRARCRLRLRLLTSSVRLGASLARQRVHVLVSRHSSRGTS